MNKSVPKSLPRFSNKENRSITPIDTPQKSTRTLGASSRDRPISNRGTLKEHNSNSIVKSTSKGTNWDGKTENVQLDNFEDDFAKSERLETQMSQLYLENQRLKETVNQLRSKTEPNEGAEDYQKKYQDLEQTMERLQEQLNKNMHRILNYDSTVAQVAELKREKEHLIIQFDKEKASLESRIMELKEQIEIKDKKLEQRITNEHNNRQAINTNLNKALDQNEKWRKLYLMEAKSVINLQHQYKALIEDNKCHMEYMSQLENKIQQLEAKYYDLYTDYHQRLTEYRIENLKSAQAELDRIRSDHSEEEFSKMEEKMMIFALQNELNKEKEISADFKAQVDRLVDVKQELERNLALSRHNILDMTGKLEEECAKVAALEDMRINDLQLIASLESEY